MPLTIERLREGAQASMYIPRYRVCLTDDDKLALHGTPEASRLLCIPGRAIAQEIADELHLKEFEDALDKAGHRLAEIVEPAQEAETSASADEPAQAPVEKSEPTQKVADEVKDEKPKRAPKA